MHNKQHQLTKHSHIFLQNTLLNAIPQLNKTLKTVKVTIEKP